MALPNADHTSQSPVYNLRDLSAPVVTGIPRRFLVYTLEHPYAGLAFRHIILANSGFTAFRALKHPDTTPTLPLPIHRPLPASSAPTLAAIQTLLTSLDAAQPSPTSPPPPRPNILSFWRAYEHGHLTPLDVARALLQAIHTAHAASLNAILHVDKHTLLADARASTQRWARACPRSFLDGVPFTVKDSIDAVPFPTANGQSSAHPTPARADADAVKALRDAGMLLLAKCRQDEMGIGVRGYSAHTGQIRNPHDLSRVPGGSSGGDAAAVAVGFAPVAIAADAGGSIRIPASCCGIFGIKPTYATVSPRGRVWEAPHPPVATHFGPLAATAQDLAIMHYVLAGFAPHPPISELDWKPAPPPAPPTIPQHVAGIKVAIFDAWNQSADAQPRATCDRFLRAASAAGASVDQIVIPELEQIRVSLSICLMREVIATGDRTGAYGRGNMSHIGYDARAKISVAQELDESDEQRARATRERAIQHAKRVFEDVDVIVTPALACATPPVPQNEKDGVSDAGLDSRLMRFMTYANLTGLPACSIPVEKVDGMPVAVQVIAAPWREETLLRVCLWADKEFNVTESMVPTKCYNALASAANQ